MSKQPIGVFDSGIGGLTVAKAINDLLPKESIVYFGDTAHLPYGDKAPYSIKHYSHAIAEFLQKQDCKAIIIACNTASSVAARPLKKLLPKGFPLINVIDPVVDHVAASKAKKVGVIATKGTIGSRVYPKWIKAANEALKVSSLATPLLAPMIEEGFFNNNISRTIIGEYLSKRSLKDIDSLILGCTHYPLIENEVKEYYQKVGRKVNVVNSAQVVAENVKTSLKTLGLLSSAKKAQHHFYVSDYTKSFEQSTKFFFGDEVKLEKMDLWK